MSTLMSFTVGTNDFRRSLKAVTPNASRDTDLPSICRVRCYVDSENVTVAATDRFTAALGLVSVWDNELATEGSIDLGLVDIGKILAVFTAGKDKADAPEWQLRIELLQKRTITEDDKPDVSALTVRVTDVSGMIHGEVLDLPALTPHESFPDLPQLFSNHLAKPAGMLDHFAVSGELLARMKTAAHVYGDEPLILSTPGAARAPIIARCGDSFLGLVMPVRLDDEGEAQVDERQAAWMRRLPMPNINRVIALDEIIHSVDNDKSDKQIMRAAIRMVVMAQFGSASMLQRRLGIGFAKAGDVLKELEALGIVGPSEGSKARDVLIHPDDVEAAIDKLDQETGDQS